MADEERHFGAWDYVVFSLMLAVSAAIGIFYGCKGSKQKTTKEFLMANRSMSIVPVAISILVRSNYIPFSPLPKIANCGEVCASQLVTLRHQPREDDDDDPSTINREIACLL